MKIDDPAVRKLIKRAMVARIATLSRNGRPSVNPLYFAVYHGKICLGTASWTLAARNVQADERVSVLFNDERRPGDPRVLRITGRAVVKTGAGAMRPYAWRVALKYLLPPGGIANTLTHLRLRALQNRYRAQSKQKGPSCVIEVTPQTVEWVE